MKKSKISFIVYNDVTDEPISSMILPISDAYDSIVVTLKHMPEGQYELFKNFKFYVDRVYIHKEDINIWLQRGVNPTVIRLEAFMDLSFPQFLSNCFKEVAEQILQLEQEINGDEHNQTV